jgi:outer membrane protein OmpA-like peptidoglycan-associated protein
MRIFNIGFYVVFIRQALQGSNLIIEYIMAVTDKFKQLRSNPAAKKTFVGVLITLIVFSIVGFFLVPPILKSVLTRKLSESLHRQVSIRQVKVNPFMLSVTLRGFLIKEKKGPAAFISFDELYVNLQSISILKRGLILSEIKVNKPYINIVRNEDGSYNFSDLLKSRAEKEEKKPRFSFNNIQILTGSIDFLDGPKHTAHKLRDIDIKIPFISSLPYYADIYVQPSFEAKVNDTPVSFKGETKPFKDSLETYLNINIKDLDIPFYMAYSPVKLLFKIPSGFLDINTRVSYIQYKDRSPSLNVTGSVAFKKIKIVDLKENPIVSLPAFEISFAPSDFIAKKIHLAEVMVQSPELNISRDSSAKINLLHLLPEKQPQEKPPAEEATPLSLDADHIQVTDGKIEFSDFKSIPFKTTLQMIEIGIDNLSTAKDKKAKAHLSLQTESKESMRLESVFSINPLLSEGILELGRIQLKKYSPYYSQSVLFDVREGGLDLSTRYIFKKTEKEPEIRLAELSAVLTSMKLRKRGDNDDLLSIPVVSLKNTSVDLTKREVDIGIVSTQKGLLKIKRYSDGKLNIQRLLAESGTSGEKPGKTKKGQEMLVTLKDISVDRYMMKIEDSTPHEPVNLIAERINFKGTNLSTVKNSKGRVSLSFVFNKKGSVMTNGSVSINPLSANMKVSVKGVEIAPFQSYFTDRVRIIVTQGDISLNGSVSAGYSKDDTMNASYKGEASVRNFASLDKAKAEEFLKWKSLYFGGMDATYNPLYVNIAQVALTDFYSRIIINKDGSINLQQVMQEKYGGEMQKIPEAPQEKPADVTTKPPDMSVPQKTRKLIKIDTVTFQGGTINFSDSHIEPNFSSSFLEIGGRVSGLSSEENKFADVDLRGKLENYAPLEITGKINPLRDDLYVDLKVDFKNMDLSPLTPYSGRYLGYTIQKGALSLNLQYLIVKKKLDSQNNIFLDQFTLGHKVESPEATKLPVRLAIALLKNRKGEIDLNIPVSGYIDDPKFSMGRIIIKILVNLLTKAATSPFALLGAIFGGGGEELSYVEFDYGSYDLGDQGTKKIDNLVKALFDRPALTLEIEGHVDVEKDKEALRQYLFTKKIKAQKLKDLIKKGQSAIPVDKITIEKEEYAKYLKMAYKAEKFPKPRTILGFTKSLPVPEMEKLMLTHIEVKDDDLRQLASQRALEVKDYILRSGQVAADRVFLIEPKTLEPEKKEKLKNSRVDFKLK